MEIDLRKCRLPGDWSVFGAALSVAKVSILVLQSCEIDDARCGHIGEGLTGNIFLTSLDLSPPAKPTPVPLTLDPYGSPLHEPEPDVQETQELVRPSAPPMAEAARPSRPPPPTAAQAYEHALTERIDLSEVGDLSLVDDEEDIELSGWWERPTLSETSDLAATIETPLAEPDPEDREAVHRSSGGLLLFVGSIMAAVGLWFLGSTYLADQGDYALTQLEGELGVAGQGEIEPRLRQLEALVGKKRDGDLDLRTKHLRSEVRELRLLLGPSLKPLEQQAGLDGAGASPLQRVEALEVYFLGEPRPIEPELGKTLSLMERKAYLALAAYAAANPEPAIPSEGEAPPEAEAAQAGSQEGASEAARKPKAQLGPEVSAGPGANKAAP